MRTRAGFRISLAVIALLASAPASAPAQPFDTTMFRALQWRNLPVTRGGRATTGVGVPDNPRVYYFGATGGGVWKTEDAGASWNNISDGYFATGSVGDIALFARDPSIIYVGMGEAPVRNMMSSYGDGVYKSTDAGRTWTHLGLEKTRQISRVVIHPTDPNVVYVAAQGSRWAPTDDRGVYRSTDGGATWKRVHFVSGSAGAADLVMDPRDPRVLYATFWDFQRVPWAIRSGGPGSGIWKTTDAGETWTRLGNGLPALFGKARVAIAPSLPNRIYANIEADSGGMYRSEDGGATWRRVSGNRGLLARPWYFMSVTVDPNNADIVYAPGFSFLKSTDGGVTWASRPSTHSDNHRLWINPSNPQNLFLLNDGGATISFDGGDTWTSDDNQATAQFYAVQMDDLFPYNLYAGQQDAGSTKMPSRSIGGVSSTDWTDVGGGESARFAFDPKNPTVVYATGFLAELHRTDLLTGLGTSVTQWPGGQHLGSSAIEMPYRHNWSAPLTWSPWDTRVMYHGANVVFRSTDGYTWVPISPDLTRNEKNRQGRSGLFWHDGSGGEVYNTIFSIVESPRERGHIWVGTDDGLVQLTRDNGRTWKNVTPPNWGEGLVTTIDVSRHADGTAFVAFTRHKWDDNTPHFYVTRDYGSTWTDLATTLPQLHPARVIREDPVRKDLLFAATEHGLWISFNGGRAWQSFQRGVPIVPISEIQIHHDDLILATEGRGFWIMDDMTPLRQLTAAVPSARLFLFKPRPAIRVSASARSGGLNGSALIRYSLSATLAPSDSLKLDILNSGGTVVRHYVTAGGAAPVAAANAGRGGVGGRAGGGGGTGGRGGGRGGAAANLSTTRGLNQFSWDLRGRETDAGNMYAMPVGRYTARMTLGAVTVSESFDIQPDPRAGSTPAAEQEHGIMVRELVAMSGDVNRALTQIRDLRPQARSAGLRATLDSLEGIVIWTQNAGGGGGGRGGGGGGGGGLDVMHNAPRLSTDVNALLSLIEGRSGPVTTGEREQFQRLKSRSAALRAAVDRVVAGEPR